MILSKLYLRRTNKNIRDKGITSKIFSLAEDFLDYRGIKRVSFQTNLSGATSWVFRNGYVPENTHDISKKSFSKIINHNSSYDCTLGGDFILVKEINK